MEVRLQKYLADAGVASRRKAEEYILSGKVKVNGVTVTELGTKVDLKKDKVTFNDKIIKPQDDKIYIVLNKPQGYISAAKDQFDNLSVLHLIKDCKKRLFPVGRLDKDTTGILILTNDGDLVNKITHPKNEIEKTYIAKIWGKPTSSEMAQFMKGLIIDGEKTSPAKIKIIEEKGKFSVVEIKIHEGRNRQVKKMCEEINHKVVTLHRKSIGKLSADDLEVGKWRYITKKELISKIGL
ncbi:MAG: rRNA pseudouridine synthase [Clostridia bacterium]|nr:rRNA pseudouridine synthase [Clostridia bacterium]